MGKKLKEVIKKGGWWLAEGPVNFLYIYTPTRAFARTRRYVNFGWTIGFIVYKREYCYQYLNLEETMQNVRFLLRGNTLEKQYTLWKDKCKGFYQLKKAFEKTDLKKISSKGLSRLYKKFDSITLDLWDIAIIIEGSGMYADILTKRIAESYDMPFAESMMIVNSIGKSPKPSFVAKEHIDFLKLCLMHRRKDRHFEKKLREHQKKYFWMENNYKKIDVIPAEEFRSRVIKSKSTTNAIKAELKRLQKKEDISRIVKKYKLGKKDVSLLKKFGRLSMWMDERKELVLKSNQIYNLLLREIAGRLKLSLRQVHLLLPKEIPAALERNKKIPKREFKKREVIMIIADKSIQNTRLIFGKEAKEIINLLAETCAKELPKNIKGMPTWDFGKRAGTAQIVLDVEKSRFIPGRILVTSMTRPEFTPLIKKSAGVITNEGGITCHAAIVSREFKIPCIIGTKIATKALKTGNHIELDSKEGIVRILK